MSAEVRESGYQTATMNNGLAMLTLSPHLSIGTVGIRARVTDLASNAAVCGAWLSTSRGRTAA
jgi:hypothetical protein